MTKSEKTIAGTWYTITCTASVSVTEQIQGETAPLAKLSEAGTAAFRASGSSVTVETEGKYNILPTRAPAIAAMGGGAYAGTGETIVPLEDSNLPIQHGIWYKNTTHTDIAVLPSELQNRVSTCYLITSIPVKLTGVEWLYGEPFMGEGFDYVIAMQYIDGRCLANLAYTMKQPFS